VGVVGWPASGGATLARFLAESTGADIVAPDITLAFAADAHRRDPDMHPADFAHSYYEHTGGRGLDGFRFTRPEHLAVDPWDRTLTPWIRRVRNNPAWSACLLELHHKIVKTADGLPLVTLGHADGVVLLPSAPHIHLVAGHSTRSLRRRLQVADHPNRVLTVPEPTHRDASVRAELHAGPGGFLEIDTTGLTAETVAARAARFLGLPFDESRV